MKPSAQQIEKRLKLKRLRSLPANIILDPRFIPQNRFIEDKSRYLAAQCSRRAGKTNGLALRFFKTMEKYPGSQCLYLALTRDSARAIMWGVLQELSDQFKIGCEFTETRLTMRHPNGAVLRLLGADQKNFIKRVKGIKSPGVGVDEAQDFSGSVLQPLIDDVLTPCISDYPDGWLALTGTPGPVPNGFFFDITKGGKYGFSCHYWTLLDNPYMPNPTSFIEDLKAKRQWDENNSTLQREWRNRWVLDLESLWIRYHAQKDDYAILPPADTYHYILGVDIGFKDADALAILAYGDKGPTTYLIEEVITAKQGLTELADQILKAHAKYNFEKMVIDEGGLGKKLAEEMRKRQGLPLDAADKMRKQENVEILNDAMRLGRFKAKTASRFVQDSYLIQIDWDKSTPNRIVIKKNPHSDIIDAVLYAFKESPAYVYEAPKKKPVKGTPEWAKAETEGMFERELEGLQKDQAYNNWAAGEDDFD